MANVGIVFGKNNRVFVFVIVIVEKYLVPTPSTPCIIFEIVNKNL